MMVDPRNADRGKLEVRFSHQVARRSAQEARQYKARAAQRAEAYFCRCSLAHSHLGATEVGSDFRSASERVERGERAQRSNGGLSARFDRRLVRNAG